MNTDQPTGNQGPSSNIHRALCDLILDADEAEVDRIIIAFRQDPQQLEKEGRETLQTTLNDLRPKIIPLPGNDLLSSQIDASRPHQGFGRFVQMFRRREELSIEELSKKADVSAAELRQIEGETGQMPKPRTLFQLERFFKLPPDSLGKFSGAVICGSTTTSDDKLLRFAACSDGMGKLSKDEKHLLAQFVKHLAEK